MSLLRGTSIVASLTLLSRLLGFLRDFLTAYVFGAGIYADAYIVAFRIPNLLRSIFAEGALTSAFVPTFASEVKEGKESSERALASVTSFLLFCTGVVVCLAMWWAPEVLEVIAPGFLSPSSPEKGELTILLMRIMMPLLTAVSIVALLNGVLNTLGVFGASAWAQVAMNLCLIAGGLLAILTPTLRLGVIVLSASVLIGGIVQVIVQLPALKKAGFHWRLTTTFFNDRAVKETTRLMLPAILGATVYQLSIFISTVIASLLPAGTVSWLFYADRVTQLPIGVFTVALASVLLPTLAKHATDGSDTEFHRSLNQALIWTSIVIIPTATFLFVFAPELVSLVFMRGKFMASDVEATAGAVRGLSVGLWATSCHSMIVRAFSAKKDTKTQVFVGFCSLMITVLISVSLVGPLEGEGILGSFLSFLQHLVGSHASLGHVGLSLGSAAGAFASLLLIVAASFKKFPTWQAAPFLRISALSWILAAIAAYGAKTVALSSGGDTILHVILAGTVFGGLYGVSSYVGVVRGLRKRI